MAYPRVAVPSLRAYPRMGNPMPRMIVAPAQQLAYARRARMNGYARSTPRLSGLLDDIGSLFTPNPGGGSVTVDGTTSYVNSAGVDQSTEDPSAGASILSDPGAVLTEDVEGVASAATGGLIPNPQSPTNLPGWVLPAAGVGVGLLLLKIFL